MTSHDGRWSMPTEAQMFFIDAVMLTWLIVYAVDETILMPLRARRR